MEHATTVSWLIVDIDNADSSHAGKGSLNLNAAFELKKLWQWYLKKNISEHSWNMVLKPPVICDIIIWLEH